MRDEWFRLLEAEPRRQLLYELLEREEAEPVVVLDDSVAGDAGTAESALHLHHVHLPKLVDADVVTWDPAEGTVRPGPAFQEIKPLLQAVEPLVDTDSISS